MKFPAKLKDGGTVGLLGPSSPADEAKKNRCIETLENMGYRVKAADNLTSNCAGYMAGTGKVRGEWINRMFADPEIDAIFCMRGGDGGTRAFEYVDLDIVRNNPKIFVGYSDVTTWHLLFNQSCDLITFHGPMVASNMIDEFDPETRKSFFDCINGDEKYVLKNPEGYPVEVLKPGKAKAPVIGGNMSLIAASMATPYEMDSKGKIIFIEEVNEHITKIEKWAYQLRNAGKFRDCAGVMLGQFTDITDIEDWPMPEYGVMDIFEEVLKDYDIPVIYNLQIGHGEKNMTIPMGAVCTLDTGTQDIIFDIER